MVRYSAQPWNGWGADLILRICLFLSSFERRKKKLSLSLGLIPTSRYVLSTIKKASQYQNDTYPFISVYPAGYDTPRYPPTGVMGEAQKMLNSDDSSDQISSYIYFFLLFPACC